MYKHGEGKCVIYDSGAVGGKVGRVLLNAELFLEIEHFSISRIDWIASDAESMYDKEKMIKQTVFRLVA